MSTIQLTRVQRREMKKLAERVDRVAQADARFFERFPHRQTPCPARQSGRDGPIQNH